MSAEAAKTSSEAAKGMIFLFLATSPLVFATSPPTIQHRAHQQNRQLSRLILVRHKSVKEINQRVLYYNFKFGVK